MSRVTCTSIKLGKRPYYTHPGPRFLTKEKVDVPVQSVLGNHGLWVPPATLPGGSGELWVWLDGRVGNSLHLQQWL